MATNFRYTWLNVRRDERAWTPYDLGGALREWWHADDHGTAWMTDDGAGLISAWVGRIGALTPAATTTLRPTWSATAFNAAKAGLTATSATGMTVVATTGLPTSTTPGELWGLASQDGAAGSERRLFSYGSATTSRARAIGRDNATPSKLRATTLGENNDLGTLSGPAVMRGTFQGTVMGNALNGAALTTVAILSLQTDTTRTRIFASAAGGVTLNWIGVGRQILVTRLLPPLDVLRMEGYLAHDGAIASVLPALHRFKSAAPTMELTRIMSFPGFTIDLPRAA